MGFFDRILGTGHKDRRSEVRRVAPNTMGQLADEQALERYRYMVRTAPPETIEQAHAEAFARLSPGQRGQILEQLAKVAPSTEREAAAAISPDDSQAMGRLATRTELRQPGFIERALGGFGAAERSLLGSFAMGFLGSTVANSFFASLDKTTGTDALVDHDHGASGGTEDLTDIASGVDEGDLGGELEGDDVDSADLGDTDIGSGDFDV